MMTTEAIVQLIKDELVTAEAIIADPDACNDKGRYGWTCRRSALKELLSAIEEES